MAIFVHCPHCHEQLADTAATCPHCGQALPIGVTQALSSASGAPPPPFFADTQRAPGHLGQVTARSPVPRRGAWRPWLAAGLSVISGLGQFYNGQVTKGVVLACGAVGIAAAIAFMQSYVAMVIAPLWWGAGIVDAYKVALRG